MPFHPRFIAQAHFLFIAICSAVIAQLIGGITGAVVGYLLGVVLNHVVPHPSPEVHTIKEHVRSEIEKIDQPNRTTLLKTFLWAVLLSICIAALIGHSPLPYGAAFGSFAALLTTFFAFPVIAKKFLRL